MQYLRVWVCLRTRSEEVLLLLGTAHHRSQSPHPQPVATHGCCCQHMAMMQVAGIGPKSDGIDMIWRTSSFDLQSPAWDGPIRRSKLLLLLDHSSLVVLESWTRLRKSDWSSLGPQLGCQRSCGGCAFRKTSLSLKLFEFQPCSGGASVPQLLHRPYISLRIYRSRLSDITPTPDINQWQLLFIRHPLLAQLLLIVTSLLVSHKET
jgi:hypothetical protein